MWFILAMLALHVIVSSDGQWATSRGDAQNTGHVHGQRHSGRGAFDSPSFLWAQDVNEQIFGSIAVGLDESFVVTPDDGYGSVYSFSEDGSLKWKFKAGPFRQCQTTPVIANDGSVYVCQFSGGRPSVQPWLLSLSSSGQLRWVVNDMECGNASPALSPDFQLLFVGLYNGTCCGVSTNSGNVIWSRSLVGPPHYVCNIQGSINVHPKSGTVFVGCGCAFYALDPLTGIILWSNSSLCPGSSAALSIDGKLVFVTDLTNGITALDCLTGEVLWAAAIVGSGYPTGPVVVGDLVLVGGSDNFVYSFNVSSGALKWKTYTNNQVGTMAASSDGSVMYVPTAGHLFGLRVMDGLVLWTLPLGSMASFSLGPPSINAKGVLVLAVMGSNLTAFRVS